MIGILPLIIKKTRPIYNRAGQKCGNNGPGGAGNLPRGFAAGEMRPNGSKGRGESGSRVWEKRKAPRCRGDDYESPTAYFLSIKKVGKER